MTNEEREILIMQGWTPPYVDPDIEKADMICEGWHDSESIRSADLALAGIKIGRKLEQSEIRPGVTWAKHDGSEDRPVSFNCYVCVCYKNKTLAMMLSIDVTWSNVTHYAIVYQPEDK
jgi:hypothetical protein